MTGGPSEIEEEAFWRSRSWWGRAGKTAAGVWASSVFSILTTVVAARALGPGEYGSVFLAISVVTSVSTFLDVTLEEATVFYGNRALVSGRENELRALLWKSLRLDIAIGVLVAGAIVALATPLANVASSDSLDPALVQIIALSVLVTTADSTAYAALNLARRADLRGRSMAVTSAFRLLGVLIAVQLGGAEAVALSYAVGGAAGSIVLGRLAWRAGWGSWASQSRPAAGLATAWELVRFGFHSSVTTSVQSVSGTIVPVLLARASGPAAVGIFRVAMLPVIAAQVLSGPIRLAIFPEQAKLVAEGRTAEIRTATRGYTVIALVLGLSGALVAWIAMPWLITFLYGSDFEGAVTPARILLIAAVFRLGFGWRKSLLAAMGRPEIRTRLSMIQLAVVAAVMLAIGDPGPEGAAVAVSAGSVAIAVAWLIIAPRILREESLLASRGLRPKPESRAGGRAPPGARQNPTGVSR